MGFSHPHRAPTSAAATGRRLIVNADDFGLSSSVNAAVESAHQGGILTTASLMVNEAGFDEAVRIARRNSSLGVGLHLTFLFGHSSLPQARIPGLVNGRNEFGNAPAAAGFRFFFKRSLREELRAEIHAQFERFHRTGLALDHVNGHLHMHLHPVIFAILLEDAEQLGITAMRLTRDPFWLNRKIADGRLFYRVSHAVVFNALASRARARLARRDFKHTGHVFGLLQNSQVDERYVLRLLERLPAGNSELYSHPSLDEFKHELDALTSARVRNEIAERGVKLIRYQDL